MRKPYFNYLKLNDVISFKFIKKQKETKNKMEKLFPPSLLDGLESLDSLDLTCLEDLYVFKPGPGSGPSV